MFWAFSFSPVWMNNWQCRINRGNEMGVAQGLDLFNSSTVLIPTNWNFLGSATNCNYSPDDFLSSTPCIYFLVTHLLKLELFIGTLRCVFKSVFKLIGFCIGALYCCKWVIPLNLLGQGFAVLLIPLHWSIKAQLQKPDRNDYLKILSLCGSPQQVNTSITNITPPLNFAADISKEDW